MGAEEIVVGILLIGMLGAGIYASSVVDKRLKAESEAERKAAEERAGKRSKKAR